MKLLLGDCLEEMAKLEANSVDAVVTDPPYGISFMGKAWDGKDIQALMQRKMRKETVRPDGWERHDGAAFAAGTYDLSSKGLLAFQLWTQEWAEQALRVLKPGGHLLSFASPRTYHRMVVGIEDAGFEIRDQIMWLFGSGFPKSLNVGKVLPEWEGWGTALKPAHEPIVVARKPLEGTVAENVLKHGVGGLNVNGCRVETGEILGRLNNVSSTFNAKNSTPWVDNSTGKGRWPANVAHDGSEEVVAGFPQTESDGGPAVGTPRGKVNTYGEPNISFSTPYGANSGSAARFFYCAKASKADRDEGLGGFAEVDSAERINRQEGSAGQNNPRAGAARTSTGRNHHPTVKPTDLMRYLCRLVTPPGGVVLDPFMGSGSTGKAAVLEGFDFIGIEREADYMKIAEARVAGAHDLAAEERRAVEPPPLLGLMET